MRDEIDRNAIKELLKPGVWVKDGHGNFWHLKKSSDPEFEYEAEEDWLRTWTADGSFLSDWDDGPSMSDIVAVYPDGKPEEAIIPTTHLRVGIPVRQRNGLEAVILKDNAEGAASIEAAILDRYGDWDIQKYFPNGFFLRSGPHEEDLIPVPEARVYRMGCSNSAGVGNGVEDD